MKFGIRTKVTLAFIITIVMCMIGLNIFAETLLRPLFIYDSKKEMLADMEELKTLYERGVGEEIIKDYLEDIRDSYVIRTTIIDREGELYYTNEIQRKTKDIKNSILIQGLIEKYNKQEKEMYFTSNYELVKENTDTVRNRATINTKRMCAIQKLQDGTYLIMTKNKYGIDQDISLVTTFLHFAGILIAIVGVTFWRVITRPFTRAIERMSVITDRMANLEFDQKIQYHSNDEIGHLAKSIEDMSFKLEKSIDDMQFELESKTQMLRDLSHEIKSPLTTIKGYVENMQARELDKSIKDKYCSIILEECDSLNFLARDMMELSALEHSSDIYPIEVMELFESLNKIGERIDDHFNTVPIEKEFEKGVVYGNEKLLERVIFNFIENAIKYGEKGKKIYLEGENIESENNTFYRISVKNYGNAIDESEKEKLWKVFYKGDLSRKRTNSNGVGLAIVEEIVKLHKGNRGVVSENGQNTFYIEIPIKDNSYIR